MASNIKANRKSVRAPVIPDKVQGLLTVIDSGQQIPFLVWDVSETGMGIWTSDEISDKTKIRITLGQPYPLIIDAVVQWTHPDDDGTGYRCGIESIDDAKKMKKLYDLFKSLMEKNAIPS